MSDKAAKYMATATANIESQTGRSIDELVELIASWSDLKPGQKISRLKEELGLGHGHASMLVHTERERAERAGPATDPLDALYSGSKAALRPLHEQVMARVAGLGDHEAVPRKTCVVLRRSKNFATVGPGSRGRLEVGVNLKGTPGAGRLEDLGPGKMTTHRVMIGTAEEIDEELVGWLRVAREASA